MPKKNLVLSLCALALLCLLAACAQTDKAMPDVAERSPFRLDVGGGEGIQVSWKGYTDGFQPGTTDAMVLAVTNTTDDRWDGRICLQLLKPMPSSVVVPLARQEINLESGGGFERDVPVDLLVDLSPGIYGLTLVVYKPAGPIVSTIPVQVGAGEEEPFEGEWPTEAALAACPAP
jgi:hypothetical protein